MVNEPLKPLDEWNESRQRLYDPSLDAAVPSGLACPRCGHELLEYTRVLLASFPPQVKVWCVRSGCGFVGTRVV